MTPAKLSRLINEITAMAAEFSIETRVRRLIEAHVAAGASPRTLVMNEDTWRALVYELDGRGYKDGLYWTPQAEGSLLDAKEYIHAYHGLPILIKDFLPDQEIIIGV